MSANQVASATSFISFTSPKSTTLSEPTGLDKTVLWFLIIGAILTKNRFFIEGVSIGDVLFGCALLLLFYASSAEAYLQLLMDQRICLLFLFLLSALMGGFYLSIQVPFVFSPGNLLKALLKLLFYVGVTAFALTFLNRLPRAFIWDTVLNGLTVSALITLYIYVVMSLQLNLPYDFFWYGHSEVLRDGGFYRQSGIFTGGAVLAKGLFSEPSYLGVFNNLGLAYLYFSIKNKLQLFGWKHLIIILTLLLSFSLTSYILLAFIIMLLLVDSNNMKSIAIVSLFVAVFLLTLVASEFLQEVIVNRIGTIFRDGDNSVTLRVLGSWEVAINFLKRSFFFGAGIGHFDIAQASLPVSQYGMGEDTQGWNILAYVSGTMGILGLTLFMLIIAGLFRHQYLLGFVLVAAMFTTGAFLEPTFWFFYCLFSTTKESD